MPLFQCRPLSCLSLNRRVVLKRLHSPKNGNHTGCRPARRALASFHGSDPRFLGAFEASIRLSKLLRRANLLFSVVESIREVETSDWSLLFDR